LSTGAEIITAAQENDAARLGTLLAADPLLAAARDASGLSAVMHARYRGSRDALQLLLAAGPPLDLFEAAATGNDDRLATLVGEDPGAVNAFANGGIRPTRSSAGTSEPSHGCNDHTTHVRNYVSLGVASRKGKNRTLRPPRPCAGAVVVSG
jgi:hypothetical protein